MQNVFGTYKKSETVLFDSRSALYKTPFGAISTRDVMKINFPVKKDVGARSVKFILRRNGASKEYDLNRIGEENDYDVFSAEITVPIEGTHFYRFEIYPVQGGTLYCGKDGKSKAIIGEWLPEWQLSVYQSHYKTADFIKGGVVYHMFVDRFRRKGDFCAEPRYGTKKDWEDDVTIVDPDGTYRANDFFGGNFDGMIEKLPYLQSLGVNVIYLSPIFESSSNHRYDTADYTKVDPVLGGDEAFERFLKACKKKKINVVLDGVFNHTGADSVYFNKFGHYDSVGAYQSKESPYYDWFTFYNFPDDYHCWWGCTVVPTVARNADGYHELIAGKNGIIHKWTKMGVKGWRLDVVDELSEYFVKKIRESVKGTDETALVLGEVWEDASTKYSYGEEREYFFGYDLDGVMNYVFKDAINSYITAVDAEGFVEKVLTIMENYPKQSLDTCFTMIDSHDTVRAINVYAGATGYGMSKAEKKAYRLTEEEYARGKRRLKVASALQYFLPGAPSLYYGDEAGLQGFEDPLNRRPYPWGKEDEELLEHYRMLGRLRSEYREDFQGAAAVSCEDGKVIVARGRLKLTADARKEEFKIETIG